MVHRQPLRKDDDTETGTRAAWGQQAAGSPFPGLYRLILSGWPYNEGLAPCIGRCIKKLQTKKSAVPEH